VRTGVICRHRVVELIHGRALGHRERRTRSEWRSAARGDGRIEASAFEKLRLRRARPYWAHCGRGRRVGEAAPGTEYGSALCPSEQFPIARLPFA
jgi:hypothetical protein